MSPSRKPTEPPQRSTRPSAITKPGPTASRKLILSSSVGTAKAKLALGDRGIGHGGIDHAGEEAALADAALRMAEGRHDLEAEAAEAALGIELEDLAVQEP